MLDEKVMIIGFLPLEIVKVDCAFCLNFRFLKESSAGKSNVNLSTGVDGVLHPDEGLFGLLILM